MTTHVTPHSKAGSTQAPAGVTTIVWFGFVVVVVVVLFCFFSRRSPVTSVSCSSKTRTPVLFKGGCCLRDEGSPHWSIYSRGLMFMWTNTAPFEQHRLNSCWNSSVQYFLACHSFLPTNAYDHAQCPCVKLFQLFDMLAVCSTCFTSIE